MPADGFAAAEFIVRHLYRPLELAGARYGAAAETEHPLGGDTWFWTDDNAKILEFLSRPELWRRFPDEFAEMLRFVRAMCREPFIFRRASLPRLDAAERGGGFERWHHSLLTIGGDLGRGIVTFGPRFHDDRGSAIWLTGNHVEFTWRGRRRRIAIEPAIDDTESVLDGGRLTLRHAGDVSAGGRKLGRVSYTYTFDARMPAFEIEAALDIATGVELGDVVLTIGHRHLGAFRDAVIVDNREPPGAPLFTVAVPTRRHLDVAGAAYYQIRQGRISGDAPAVHSQPREPRRLAAIEVTVRQPWVPHRIVARYEFPGRHSKARLVAAETKMLTSGGLYQRIGDYAGLLREAAAPAPGAVVDYSIAYDYGSVINAFAKVFAVYAAGAAPAPVTLRDEVRALCDGYLDTYFRYYVDEHERRPDAIFSRELAFVTLAAVTMCRATGDRRYREMLQRLCDVLLDFAVAIGDVDGCPASATLMRMHSPEAGPADCHAAVLLALTRAAPLLADPRLPAAIDRGLSGYHLRVFDGYLGTDHRFEAVATAMAYNHRRHHPLVSHWLARRYRRQAQPVGADPIIWTYKAGLSLRLFGALRQSDDPAVRAVAARHRERLAQFETALRRLLASVATERGAGVEFRALPLARETNSESQPWAMLGLLGHPFD